jgi:type VI secretion system secreted protein Hcp
MKMNPLYRVCALLCVLLISGFDVSAALNAYFKADGISGDSTRTGWQDYLEVNGFSHEVIAPIDAQSGQATGKRQHKPFKILKEISKNSPQFETFLISGRPIANAELKLLRASQTGQEENYYIYKFKGVRIISVRDWMANNNDPNAVRYPHLQEITFVYQSIEWQSLPDGTSALDDWSAPIN